MTDDSTCKLLEDFMGWKRIKPGHGSCCTCQKCGHDYDNCFCTDWDTEADMMALYRRLWETGKWTQFYGYTRVDAAKGGRSLYGDDHSAWLFCLSGEGYEERCQMVARFLEGNDGRNKAQD